MAAGGRRSAPSPAGEPALSQGRAGLTPAAAESLSVATLLWRRVLRQPGPGPSLREFTTLGLLSVPATLAAGVLALWAALHVLGG